MAKRVTIPIENDIPNSPCTYYYTVEWRFTGQPTYQLYPEQFYVSPIVLENLQDGAEYDFKITRTCCDNIISPPVEITVTMLGIDTVTGFAASQPVADVVLDWNDMPDADSYELQRADNAGFTTNLVTLYTGTLSTFDDSTVAPQTYWYRVRQKQGVQVSDWATTSITAT
jgi:hypothetical protein